MLHMQQPSSDVLTQVGANLRRLRNAAGLTQSELAVRAQVSRRTLINLEAGEANISLSGLDRLADALGATFVQLVSAPTASTREINAVAWRGVAPESVAVLLGSAPASTEAQLWTWSLGAGERYDAEPDPAGWHEMILVTEGRLLLERDEGSVTLEAGAHAIFSTTQTYGYVNVRPGVTRFVRTVLS
jgi:transcriptional regulator with XRE-family HTH domain